MSDRLTTPVMMDLEDLTSVGDALRGSMTTLLDALPGVGASTSALARRLGVNRVLVSRLLNALKRDDPVAMLLHVPGPDSMRAIVSGAASIEGVPRELANDARARVDDFASLIRDRFGTRGALDAVLSAESDALRERYEENARYDVYNGMRHVIGVEGETWLTAMLFSPQRDDENAVATTTIHGVLGMRRLRPDVPVRFTFGPPYQPSGTDPDPLADPVGLREFYTNAPAPLETEVRDGRLVHALAQGAVGKDAIVDMLAVSHAPTGSRRYATPERRFGGAAVFHDVPVKTLHFDALVHRDIFPGVSPKFDVYNTGSRGPANPNDPSRDIDRVSSSRDVETFALDLDTVEAPGVPNLGAMLRRVLRDIGRDPTDYRVFRNRVSYPVHGFQYVLAFEAPEKA